MFPQAAFSNWTFPSETNEKLIKIITLIEELLKYLDWTSYVFLFQSMHLTVLLTKTPTQGMAHSVSFLKIIQLLPTDFEMKKKKEECIKENDEIKKKKLKLIKQMESMKILQKSVWNQHNIVSRREVMRRKV